MIKPGKRKWTRLDKLWYQARDKRWKSLPKPVPVKHKTSTPKLMAASSEFFPTESARWEMIDGLWRCVKVSDNIQWMLKMEPGAAKLELSKRGFSWKWVEP